MTTTSDRPAGRPANRPSPLLAAGVVVLLVAAVVLAVVALRGGGGSDAGGASGAGGDHGSGHDHGAGEPLPGCDATQLNGAMMMFDPTRADELAASTCPWPYDATIETDGGADDPAIDAPFEPRRYAELFDLVAAQRFGLCSVGRLPDEVTDGFVFGFSLAARATTCADGPATVTVDVREYVTEAWRDQQAHTARGDATLVLGRWVITLTGEATDEIATLADALVGLGAQPVTG